MQHVEKWLIEKFKKGDNSAFETIFKAYYSELHNYAIGIIGDLEASEDIIEELFIWLWENRKSVRVESSLEAYLIKIIHNRCLNYVKHQKVKQKYLNENLRLRAIEEKVQEDYIEFFKNQEYDNNEEKIRTAIENLPEQCRKIFIMNRFDELKYREIAQKLDISLSTVKNQMSIALKKIKDDLKQQLKKEENTAN